jgi:hypothetical protein
MKENVLHALAYALLPGLLVVGSWRVFHDNSGMHAVLATGCSLVAGLILARFMFNRAKRRMARFFLVRVDPEDAIAEFSDWLAILLSATLVITLALVRS